MAVWIIKRPISGFSDIEVEAEKISAGESTIVLYNERDGTVCSIAQVPGLVVARKDTFKS